MYIWEQIHRSNADASLFLHDQCHCQCKEERPSWWGACAISPQFCNNGQGWQGQMPRQIEQGNLSFSILIQIYFQKILVIVNCHCVGILGSKIINLALKGEGDTLNAILDWSNKTWINIDKVNIYWKMFDSILMLLLCCKKKFGLRDNVRW